MSRRACTILPQITLVFAIGAPVLGQSTEQVFDEARRAVAAQNLVRAQELFLEVVRLDPLHGEAFFYLAQLKARSGLETETIDYYLRATDLLPEIPRVWEFYGLWLLEHGYFQEAVRVFSRLVELVPDSAAFCGRLGEAIYSNGEPAIALQRLEACLEMDGASAHEFYIAGLSTRIVARPEAAIELFRQALLLDPDHIEVKYQFGDILLQEGRPEEAIGYLLKLPPEHLPGRYRLAVALFQLDRFEEARAAFESLLQVDPNHVRAHYQLGLLYRRLGAMELSTRTLARFRELEARDRDRRKTTVRKEIVRKPQGV